MSPASGSPAAGSPAADEALVRTALGVARAAAGDDIPVGALVLAPDGAELARAANAREATGDPTAHAEILALRAAAGVFGDGWRLSGCTLVVTLEPCTMCAGAAVAARVRRVVFGAFAPDTGAVGSLWDVVRDRRLNHRPEVHGGVLGAECAALLGAHFASHRGRAPSRGMVAEYAVVRPGRPAHRGRYVVSAMDKAKNKAEELVGKGKEGLGDATGNRDMQAEGEGDQASAGTKQAGENVKDAGKNLKDGLTGK